MKDRQGDFNIDIKDISAYVIVVLNSTDNMDNSETETTTKKPAMELSEFNIDVNWADIEVRFDRIAGRFSTIADLTLNQV